MTLPQVYQLFRYWKINPPAHELVAIGIRCFTTWRPIVEEKFDQAAHQRSLEERWKAGCMNVKQLFENMNGNIKPTGPRETPPGIGPFPSLRNQGAGA